MRLRSLTLAILCLCLLDVTLAASKSQSQTAEIEVGALLQFSAYDMLAEDLKAALPLPLAICDSSGSIGKLITRIFRPTKDFAFAIASCVPPDRIRFNTVSVLLGHIDNKWKQLDVADGNDQGFWSTWLLYDVTIDRVNGKLESVYGDSCTDGETQKRNVYRLNGGYSYNLVDVAVRDCPSGAWKTIYMTTSAGTKPPQTDAVDNK
jgi:hypothetical protein